MNNLTKKILIILAIVCVVPTMGLSCTLFPSNQATQATQDITLKYWRVFDDSDTMDDIIGAYNDIHPNVRIEFARKHDQMFLILNQMKDQKSQKQESYL